MILWVDISYERLDRKGKFGAGRTSENLLQKEKVMGGRFGEEDSLQKETVMKDLSGRRRTVKYLPVWRVGGARGVDNVLCACGIASVHVLCA